MNNVKQLFKFLSLIITLCMLPHDGAHAMDSSNTVFDFTTCADSYLKQLAHQKEFSGTVLVALNDKVILRNGYGFARPGIANTPNTRFCIGSITKSFTAMLILQLAQEGKLAINDPIKKYIPEFKHESVTIHYLLTMTSGLPRDFWSPEDSDAGLHKTRITDWVVESIIDMADNVRSLKRSCTVDLKSKPGEKCKYSNLGYLLLAHIVDLVDDGHSYETSLYRRIFTPLNMKSSSASSCHEWERDDNSEVVFACTVGKPTVVTKPGYAGCWDYGLVHGAGSIVSTVDDVYKWASCLHKGFVLNKEYDIKMKTPSGAPKNGQVYACGLVVQREELKDRLWHNGDMSCFSSRMDINQYHNQAGDVLTIVVLANNGDADIITNGLSTIFEKKHAPVLQKLADTTCNDIDLKFEGIYIEDGKPESKFTIQADKENTLWLCKDKQHLRMLKCDQRETFGSTMCSFTLTFERDQKQHTVIGFSLLDPADGQVLHYTKQ